MEPAIYLAWALWLCIAGVCGLKVELAVARYKVPHRRRRASLMWGAIAASAVSFAAVMSSYKLGDALLLGALVGVGGPPVLIGYLAWAGRADIRSHLNHYDGRGTGRDDGWMAKAPWRMSTATTRPEGAISEPTVAAPTSLLATQLGLSVSTLVTWPMAVLAASTLAS